ncbi:MAG: threonine synthase, partial [Candidatus Binatia bacterium]
GLHLLELFHGPTLAFKDVALQLLGLMLDHTLLQRGQHATIVGATSGDTGSAAIEAVRDRKSIDIFMLYPHGRVSEVQRRQMTTVLAPNVHNVAISGTFDDCQDLAKACFNDLAFRDRHALTAVNSINFARVMAQIVYYFWAALKLGAPERPVAFAVPTGNFGNVYAGYAAKQMGLPIHHFVIGSNTNETLQPLGQWFIQRLGPGIVGDVFRWAHEADPNAQLVFNEWIVEVFTGFANPTAANVRDRVLALLADGVPVHAIGQQAHFTPAAAFFGQPVDLNVYTPIDQYAVALDTLAEAGLPIHITETNFIAPQDPALRAAHAEGLLRLWWGHPAVEQIVFWGPWNKVAGRDEFDVGLWDNDRVITRHGAAVLSLLNDRWRTDVDAVADADGVVELTATYGEHVAEWTVGGAPVHAAFRVEPGAAPLALAPLAP